MKPFYLISESGHCHFPRKCDFIRIVPGRFRFDYIIMSVTPPLIGRFFDSEGEFDAIIVEFREPTSFLVPKIFWKWPLEIYYHLTNQCAVAGMRYYNPTGREYSDFGHLFVSELEAIMALPDTVEHKTGNSIKGIMDSSDIVQLATNYTSFKIIESQTTSPIPFEKRKYSLFTRIIYELDHLYIRCSGDPDLINKCGKWDMQNNCYRIPKDINVTDFYSWLSSGNWIIFSPNREFLNISDQDLCMLNEQIHLELMGEYQPNLMLSAQQDNAPWIISVNWELLI